METALQPITESGLQIADIQRVIGEAPATLEANRLSAQKAIKAADVLIKNKDEVGMSDNLDGQMAAYIEKGKKTLTAINERRKPFTQIVDTLKKEFTGIESALKDKVAEVQTIRDAYATKKMEEQREKERQAAAKLAKEREAIELRQTSDTMISESFNEHLLGAKKVLMDKFNALVSDGFDACFAEISDFPVTLTSVVYSTFRPTLKSDHHTGDEIRVITSASMNASFGDHADTYSAKLSALKRELIDKKQSKKSELEAIEKAGEEERARLEEERKQREEAERKRLEDEAKAAQEKAAADAAVKASAATAAAMVDTQAEISAETPQVKEGYEIQILNVAANVLIFQMWFENEGKNLSQEKIDRVTVERMRRFCESHAIKTGELIDNKFIEYKPIYKAK